MHFLLLPLAFIYRLVVFIRDLLFRWGFYEVGRVDKPILCIGNITAGGTGKTPWTAFIADRLIAKGKSVAILSRGYKGEFEGVLKVTQDVEPYECGDEPFWLFKNTKASVYVGRDRHATAIFALKDGDYDVLLMDDGYQHHHLYRDKNIVVFDCSAEAWRYWPLPMGRMREPMSAVQRAEVCIFNKMNLANEESLSRLNRKIEPHCKEDKILKANYEFDMWFPLFDGITHDLNTGNAALACGIANPNGFVQIAEQSGIHLRDRYIFPDHYSWPIREIERICHLMKQQKIRDLLITEKDAIKLSRYRNYFLQVGIQLWVCKMKISILQGEDILEKLLVNLIGEKKGEY